MIHDEHWSDEAGKKFKQAVAELMTKIDDLEECTSEDIDALTELLTKAPTNLQDPVFSRWGTVLETCAVFIDNWAIIYFFAVGIKQHETPNSYLWQCSCALLSLMNNRTEQPSSDGQSIDDFISSFHEDESEDTDSNDEITLKPGDSPILTWT
ncbi:hypothetical protein ACHAXR_005590 [Thalassiosira sp. AJA248-18]